MKFLIKEISPSKKELRVTLNPIEINGISSYRFGTIGGAFDEGSLKLENIPSDLSNYNSFGPNLAKKLGKVLGKKLG